jgi:hypothetical protein
VRARERPPEIKDRGRPTRSSGVALLLGSDARFFCGVTDQFVGHTICDIHTASRIQQVPFDIVSVCLLLAEFEPQQLRIPPTPGDRQLIVGQHVGALLRLAPTRSDHHGDFGDAELPGSEHTAIAATWASVWVRAFLAYGISRSIAQRSTLSAGHGL